MASKGKEKATAPTMLFLTYKDLVKKERGGKLTKVTEGHPAWEDGLKCIEAYHKQATKLSPAQREEMRDCIMGVHYAKPPSAMGSPSSHKLYKNQKDHIETDPDSLSWPIFVILYTLYGRDLPEKYVKAVRQTYGTSEIADHSADYYAIEGAEPAGPVAVNKENPSEKKTQQAKIHSDEPSPSSPLASNSDNVLPPPTAAAIPPARGLAKLFSKSVTPGTKTPSAKGAETRKRSASPTPVAREPRRVSDNDFFSNVANTILSKSSPAAKGTASGASHGNHQAIQEETAPTSTKPNTAKTKDDAIAMMYDAAVMIKEAAAMNMEAAAMNKATATKNAESATKIEVAAEKISKFDGEEFQDFLAGVKLVLAALTDQNVSPPTEDE